MNRYGFYSGDRLINSVVCSSQEKAFEKLKFQFPNTYFTVEIKLISKNVEL